MDDDFVKPIQDDDEEDDDLLIPGKKPKKISDDDAVVDEESLDELADAELDDDEPYDDIDNL